MSVALRLWSRHWPSAGVKSKEKQRISLMQSPAHIDRDLTTLMDRGSWVSVIKTVFCKMYNQEVLTLGAWGIRAGTLVWGTVEVWTKKKNITEGYSRWAKCKKEGIFNSPKPSILYQLLYKYLAIYIISLFLLILVDPHQYGNNWIKVL